MASWMRPCTAFQKSAAASWRSTAEEMASLLRISGAQEGGFTTSFGEDAGAR